MSTAEKLAAIEDIDMAMIPLGIHVDVARTIWKFLDRRYKGADVMISANEDEKAYGKGSFGRAIVLYQKLEAPSPIGFLLHGKTGCGKTMAVNLACRMYPNVIYHEFENLLLFSSNHHPISFLHAFLPFESPHPSLSSS